MGGERDGAGEVDDDDAAAAAVACACDDDGDCDDRYAFWAASLAATAASPHVSKKLTVKKWEVMRVDAAGGEGGGSATNGI